ncbi:MAG: Serine/threonine-protein phosphatase 2A activator 1 [Piccolia ochrophora]|nr:MAG: Serine/threonine-protein phosphatase 2A activator 1 [Piccolia ochrophora]
MADTKDDKMKAPASKPVLDMLTPSQSHTFIPPAKKIHDGPDVTHFLSSQAYGHIMTFLLQLNAAMFPQIIESENSKQKATPWPIDSSDVEYSDTVQALQRLLHDLDAAIEEAPPDTGPRRFGNVSFREWYQIIEDRLPSLLKARLPGNVVNFADQTPDQPTPQDELSSYLLGSFGSSQRLDYGTGHELSFLAFLGCIWRLGGFRQHSSGVEERGIVLGVIEPYLALIRRLITTYTLEPAGSHGVWGLDDHFFLPYIFGSAQLSPAISSPIHLPTEGSFPSAPDPGGVAKVDVVKRERSSNMYFSAIGFIYDVKRGPFWEHSPMLYDISGVHAGWAKINKGMLKMYAAEVLAKFPVVQHFPFGSLFPWDLDPNAPPPLATPSPHTASQPSQKAQPHPQSHPQAQPGTKAPWATSKTTAPPAPTAFPQPSTKAPWATTSANPPGPGYPVTTKATWTAAPPPPPGTGASVMTGTRAPWAMGGAGGTGDIGEKRAGR